VGESGLDREAVREFSGWVSPRGILVVDDEPTVLAVIGQMLKDHYRGPIFFASTAVNAAEGWEEQSQIDVLVTDMALGESSGDQLAMDFVRHNPAGRVVVISGGEVDAGEVERMVGRPVSVLRKPFSGEKLQAAIAG